MFKDQYENEFKNSAKLLLRNGFLLDPGLGVLKFSKGDRMGSRAKASLKGVNGLGHMVGIGLSFKIHRGPRRLQELHHGGWSW